MTVLIPNIARLPWILPAVLLWITISICSADPDKEVTQLIRDGIEQRKVGKLAAALDSYETAIKLSESTLPGDLTRRAKLHVGCARILEDLGRHLEVPAAFEQAMKCHAATGTPPSDLARQTRLKYARYLTRREQFSRAEEILQPLLVERSEVYPVYARALTNLGELQFRTYRWDRAYRTLNEAIRRSEADSEAIANAHNNLGQLLYRLGAGEEAKTQISKAIAVYDNGSPGNPDLINAQINLVKAHLVQREFREAKNIAKQAREQAEKNRQAGQQSLLATARSAEAKAHFESGEGFAFAAQLYQRTLEDASDSGGLTSTQVATLYNNLGINQLLSGDLENAAQTIGRALDRLDELGDGPETFEQRFTMRFNEAMLLHHQGKAEAAAARAIEAIETVKENHREVLGFFPPELRHCYGQSLVRYPFHLAGTLQNPGLAIEVALHHKGIVSESVARDQAQLARLRDGGGAKAKDVEKLESLQQDFADATLAHKSTTEIKSKIRHLRSQLISTRPGSPESDADTLLNELGEDELVIDFFEFRNNRAKAGWRQDIGALVLRHGVLPRVYVIPEDQVKDLEIKLKELRQRIATAGAFNRTGPKARAEVNDWGTAVFEIILGEARQEVADCTTLTIAPDGILHHIPFSILRDSQHGGQALVMDHSIRQINSLRDLFARPVAKSVTEPRRALLVGDPDFDLDLVPDADRPANEMPFRFKPLPGSAREMEMAGEILNESHAEIQTLTGASPTETAVRASLGGKSIIHLATHGYYYSLVSNEARALRLGGVADPMLRAGLAFAGANATARAWSDHQVPDSGSDGMLTAAEIARLDLRHAQLVVLSACDTGLGEAASGQGIQGIRRALSEAGCQHVVTTLWKIYDKETVPLMHEFYRHYLAGQAPAIAMSKAQRKLLAVPGKYPWKTIRGAVPFVVTSPGQSN